MNFVFFALKLSLNLFLATHILISFHLKYITIWVSIYIIEIKGPNICKKKWNWKFADID